MAFCVRLAAEWTKPSGSLPVVCVSVHIHLPKAERKFKLRISLPPPPSKLFLFCFHFRWAVVYGEGSRVFFSFSFSVFFSFSLFVSFKGNYSPGPFQLSKVTKGNPTYSLPYPHTRLCFQQKQPLLGGSSFHKDPSSSHKLQMLLYLISGWPLTNAGTIGMLQLMLWVMLPMDNWQFDKIESDRYSECFIFLQGFLTYYMSGLSIYLPNLHWFSSKGWFRRIALFDWDEHSNFSSCIFFLFMSCSFLLLWKYIMERQNYAPYKQINMCQSPASYKYLLRY